MQTIGQRLRELIDADVALETADFDKLAGVTASAEELNYLDTSAPGTVTASKALVVDANTGIQGYRKVVTASATGAAVGVASSKGVFTNEGATGAQVFALPAAVAGLEYHFYVMAAQELRIDPSGTQTIALPATGAQQAAGKYITADAVGEYIHIVCVKAGQWEALDYRGTWTAES